MSGGATFPTIRLSCAVSLDGFLDDSGPARRVLSSPEDMTEVHKLRARSDMIVIGAQTLRNDNPSLATRSEECFALRARNGRAPHPVKVVVTRSGATPPESAFFHAGDGEKIVLTDTVDASAVEARVQGLATVVRFKDDWMAALQEIAQQRGLRDVLIEGGAQIIHGALRSGRLHHWRLAIAPLLLGASGRACIFDPAHALTDAVRQLNVASVAKFGDTTVLEIDL
ncbi:MAG TPA: RibD family protein [Vitreimonas sp.]|nr:RibD family protein [Vitreimonas sp.]